jgi:thymidylate kinase
MSDPYHHSALPGGLSGSNSAKIVLALEGVDGSGKSSLVAFARKMCAQHGCPFTAIGRSAASANPLVGRLTRFLQEEATGMTPRADLFLRIARDYQRANLAAQVPEGIVVLDRFVLSTLVLARIRKLSIDPIQEILGDIAGRIHLYATILVECPLAEAWKRVQERPPEQGPRGPENERFRRLAAELLEEEFGRGILTAKRWRVDNSGSPEVAQEQMARYLEPYLESWESAELFAPAPP